MEKAIIYGLGQRYRAAFAKGILNELNIVAYIDSNPKLWGMIANRKKVISPEQIADIDYDVIYVTSDVHYFEIRDMLINKFSVCVDKIKVLEYPEVQSKQDYFDIIKRMNYLSQSIVEMRYQQYKNENLLVKIEEYGDNTVNSIDSYWNEHTVKSYSFVSATESLDYNNKVFKMYPMLKEMSGSTLNRDGQIILDYGCGPGRDLINYSISSNLKSIIGIDVSYKSLKLSQYRLALHNIQNARLIHKDDSDYTIPLENESVDFVNCQGVLMHTSNPEAILSEFFRVLKKESEHRFCASIMVYNKDSIYYHLYIAYYCRFVDNTALCDVREITEKDNINELFRVSTDGINCPASKCYTKDEFTEMCLKAGFKNVEYMGAYFDSFENALAEKYLEIALKDEKLEECHKEFLRKVTFDNDGYAVNGDFHCGVHSVYRLYV